MLCFFHHDPLVVLAFIYYWIFPFGRKMQVHGATDLASKFQNGSDSSNLKPKEEIEDSFQLDMKVRCPCGSSLLTDSMIKVIS